MKGLLTESVKNTETTHSITSANNAPSDALPTDLSADLSVGISSFSSWMIGVGAIIGSMAWLFHGPMIARSGTLACLLAWVIAACATLPLTLILAELSSMFPAAGGPYYYKYVAFKRLFPQTGELFGFLTGWLFWVFLVVCYSCMSNGLANLLSTTFWGSINQSPIWFGPAIILGLFSLLTIMNFMHVSKAALINNGFTILKFTLAFLFLYLVISSKHFSFNNIINPTSPTGNANLVENVLSVLTLAVAAYAGIECSGCTASETKDAAKSVPKALLKTLISVAAIYFFMCIAVSSISPYTLNADKTTVVVPGTNVQATCPALAGYIGGEIWGQIFFAGVVLSIIGCGMSGLLALARVSYKIAETGLFPKQFLKLHAKTKVPAYALWFQLACLAVIGISANLLTRTGIFADAYTFLAEAAGFMYGVLALLYGVCLISLRYTDPGILRPFRIGSSGNTLAWVLVISSVLVYGYVAFFCVNWMHQLAGIIFALSGIPIFYFSKMFK
jgi:APA family basic amino acid/polyamine antiporter